MRTVIFLALPANSNTSSSFFKRQALLCAALARIAETVRDVTKLRAEVALVPPGSLPNDGKVIEDARSYE